ncbi:MAG: hypothetical protein ACRDOD_11230, partial [Streptosporangiaceae bacterium]
SNLGYIRLEAIRPALGSTQVRKVRGPLLDTLHARLMQCGNLPCTGGPFTEHRNGPNLRPNSSNPRPEWQQAADKLRTAIRSGELAPADALPSVPELHELQGLKPGARPAVESGLGHGHRVADAAQAAGVELDIKGGRHYTASQLLAGGFDLRNTAARLRPQRRRRDHVAALR